MKKEIKEILEDIIEIIAEMFYIFPHLSTLALVLLIFSIFLKTPFPEKINNYLDEKQNEYNCVTETKTIPIVFQENILENVNGNSVLGSGHVNTKNNYTVYKILDDGGKELYPINSNNTIIYDILEPDAHEYLEEDYNSRDICLAVRIYTHKWDS